MRHQEFVEIGTSPTLQAFEAGLVRMAEQMDFGLVQAALVLEQPGAEPIFLTLGNTPAKFLAACKDVDNSKRDPVLKRLRQLSVPFIYDQQLYADEGAGDLWEEQAMYGYHTGVSVGLHLPKERHFLLGVDRSSPLPEDDSKLTEIMAGIQLLAVHAQDAAQRLMGRTPTQSENVNLTAREKEILRLTMTGLTSTAISERLNVSLPTVQFHLKNIRTKFNTDSKHQAVLRALSLGII